MKRIFKKTAIFAATFVVASMSAIFAGCDTSIGGTQRPVEGLEDATVENIRRAYVDMVGGKNIFRYSQWHVSVCGYYGTYGDYTVVELSASKVGSDSTQALVDREIGNVYIDYVPDPTYDYWAYHAQDNRIISLQEAYDIGGVTVNDLLGISYAVNGGAYEENAEKIKQAYRNAYFPDGELQNVSIIKYLGTYRDCIVVELSDGSESGEENTDVIFGNIRIDSVPSSVSLWAYDVNGWYWDADPTVSLLPLETVYDRGYFTESNLLNMSYYAETQKNGGKGER